MIIFKKTTLCNVQLRLLHPFKLVEKKYKNNKKKEKLKKPKIFFFYAKCTLYLSFSIMAILALSIQISQAN